MERHFSLSINRELDLTLRSCSSLALFLSKSCKQKQKFSKKKNKNNSNIFIRKIRFCKLCLPALSADKQSIFLSNLVRMFCLVQLPVEQLDALLQLIDLNIVRVTVREVWWCGVVCGVWCVVVSWCIMMY